MTWEILLLLAVVLACPISMMWMMRGHRGGHGGGGMRGMRGMRGMGGMPDRTPRDIDERAVDRGASIVAEPHGDAERDLTVDSSRAAKASRADSHVDEHGRRRSAS